MLASEFTLAWIHLTAEDSWRRCQNAARALWHRCPRFRGPKYLTLVARAPASEKEDDSPTGSGAIPAAQGLPSSK